MVLLDLGDEGLQQPYGDIIGTRIIISITWEVALDLEVGSQAAVITDDAYLCVADC